jgi:hypothetical protein
MGRQSCIPNHYCSIVFLQGFVVLYVVRNDSIIFNSTCEGIRLVNEEMSEKPRSDALAVDAAQKETRVVDIQCIHA